MATESIAQMELCLRGLPYRRDGVKKALELNPVLLQPFYQEAMSHHYGEAEILNAIQKIFDYLEKHVDVIKEPALEFLAGGSIKTVTMINKHFRSSGDAVTYVFDYLADHGIIDKVSQTIRLTPKSKPSVEEIGYMYGGD